MQNLEYIDNFFQNELKPEDTTLFEKKIADDPEFAEDVAFYLSAQKIIRDELEEDKKRRFREIYQKPAPRGILRSMKLSRAVMAAVAVIVCIVSGIYLFNQPASTQRLADQYIQSRFNDLGTTMGTRDDMETGKDLYKQGNYTAAIHKFKTIIETNPANYLAKQYTGIAYLRLKDYDQALFYFKQVENTPLHTNPGKFYRALTLMERNQPGDQQLAKQLLKEVIKDNLQEKDVAEEWLLKL